MRKDSVLALTFAVAFIVLFLAPPFLPYTFSPYPLINWADVVDLATPLLLIPLYWLLFIASGAAMGGRVMIAFLVLAAAFVEGHGIHLAANAIGHLLRDQAGPARDLTEFWDESFSHYLWHGAVLGLSGLALISSERTSSGRAGIDPMAIAAAVIYGFALFLIGDEGGTGPMVILFAAAFLAGSWVVRERVLASPVLTMFAGGYALALVLFGIWFVYWGGRLPQFSEIGLIK